MNESTTPVDEGYIPTEPGFGADASPETEPAEPVEVEAEAAELETEPESEVGSPPAVEEDDEKKTDAFQKRINKLTESFRDSERSGLAKDAHIEDLEAKLAEAPEQTEPVKTLADFEFNEDQYRDYLFTEMSSRAEKVAEKTVLGLQNKQRTETVVEKFETRQKEFSEDIDDYVEVTQDRTLRINGEMATEIRESDIGPEMFYYLGKHPEEASRIHNLTPREVIREMATLESSIRAEKKAKPKTVSDAPPPPAKVKATEPGFKPATTDPKSDKMSDEEWFAAEAKRTAKLRGK